MKIAIPVRKKLFENNAIVENADKGNSIVIFCKKQYHQKIIDFVKSSAFSALNKNPTTSFKKV